MVPAEYFAQLVKLHKEREQLIKDSLRTIKEIIRWDEHVNYSYNEYKNSLWNKKHNELTWTFIYASIKENEHKDKTLRLLYGEN